MAGDKAAIWARVSGPEQETATQVHHLQAEAQRRGFIVVHVYQVQESAWQGVHLKALSQVYNDAGKGRFKVLLVWAQDRLSREGPLATLEIVHRLGKKLGRPLVSKDKRTRKNRGTSSGGGESVR